MRAFLPVIMAVAVALAAGCVGTWEHGASWESQSSQAPRSSPHMPTIHDYERILDAQHKSWVEVHVGEKGLVGYLMTEVSGIHDVGGPGKLYYVYNKDIERVGFFTQKGSTYRYVIDDQQYSREFIGHYETEESIAHLLKVPVAVKLVPLSVKPEKF